MATPGRGLTPSRYVPGNPPSLQLNDIVRATWDELNKVSNSMLDIDAPVSLALGTVETLVAATTPPAWTRLFNGGEISNWEKPGGSFDHATGTYTVMFEGLYQVYTRISVPPLPSPQTKDYQVQLQVIVNYIQSGKPDSIFLLEDGGLDSHYLTDQGQLLFAATKGDTVTVDGRLIRAAGSATMNCPAALEIFRVSTTK